MIKKLLVSIFLSFVLFSFISFVPKVASAQADAVCIGKDLATYMNTVIQGAGSLPKIKLLSPVFSASNPDSPAIAKEMSANGANFGGLDGIGVNAYNGGGQTITQWTQGFMSAAGLSGSVFLTETGNNPETKDINLLASEMAKIKSGGYIAALLFNALNTNGNWAQYALDETQISTVCGGLGSCGKVGVNYATFYGETPGDKYTLAKNTFGMGFTLEIARNDANLVAQQINSLPSGVTPVIRIGVEDDSGGFDKPEDYVSFLKEVSSKVNREVYAVAGPNEPGYEGWATPGCTLSDTGQGGANLVSSQDPIPEPIVSCGETRGNEFHSLRPYQASPCGMIARYVEEDTLFCGNDIVVKQNLSLLPSGGDIEPISCEYRGNGSASCTFQVENTARIEVDLRSSDLPIVGNTQLVPNEISSASVLDESARVNDYVSWFLNGTAFVAEETPITNTVKDLDRLINFSGPIKKLLPAEKLNGYRSNRIGQAKSTQHNQIYECLLFGNPIACVGGVVGLEARLKPQGTEHVGGSTDGALKLSQYIPLTSTEDRPGEVVIPEPQNLNEQTKPTQFEKDRVVVETIDFTPDPGITDLGKLVAAGAQLNPSVTNGQITPGRDDLYFAHMKETTDLAKILQNTFVSVSTSDFSGDTGMDAPYYNTLTFGKRCEFTDAKTNQGDDLFGDYNNEEKGYNTRISGTVHYKTNTFTVDFDPPSTNSDPACLATCGGSQSCEAECPTTVAYKVAKRNVYAGMAVYTKTPKLNELAERTMSVVKKFFPLDIITDVIEKKDYAAYTSAVYRQPAGEEKNGISILAGDPNYDRSGNEARLYFPHLGSVEEYFLKGIQCALRPQGMCGSADIVKAQNQASSTYTPSGVCSAPQPDSPEIDSIIAAAQAKGGAASKVPKELLKSIYFIEGFVGYKTGDYECTKNSFSALGLMQVTDSAYNWIVPPSQRLDVEEKQCKEVSGKMNRCNPVDEMEIAAGVLLVKVGKWDFQTFKPTGSITSKEDIYKAASFYYGSSYPDQLTQNFAKDNVPASAWRGGGYLNMGYGDIVCYKMGICPSYPNRI